MRQMEEKSLRIVGADKNFFGKLSTKLSAMLIPTKIGINSMLISMKRTSVIRAFENSSKEDKSYDTDEIEKKFDNSYATYLEALDKYVLDSIYKKVRNGIFEFIKDDSVGLDREIEPQDPIEMTKVQFVSALFFIGRKEKINSDWYDNKLEDEKEQIFDQLKDHCKAEYPNFIAQVTNKQDKDDKLPEIIIK